MLGALAGLVAGGVTYLAGEPGNDSDQVTATIDWNLQERET